jgi:8-oxo-dGTP pyrophosphatase MutT (NUDIX family)
MKHPFPDDEGQLVTIHQPSTPTGLASWLDAGRLATVVPGGAVPARLNGIALAPCDAVPTYAHQAIEEPPFVLPAGMAAAAGAVVVEDDGRVWLVSPTNGFGGYAATFPKGRVDPGTSLQQTAIREVFEESGLDVQVVAFLLDAQRTQTFTRYYLARRVGGSPAAMGWETQAVHLVPLAQLRDIAVHVNDAAIILAVERWILREQAGGDTGN